mmetsp:Transcript_14028/g.33376  ORF Transcript_14028/g.33376 Transcript_14028/m.33376 type:complete len:246 (-) Transcript_14028:359-1096(-)
MEDQARDLLEACVNITGTGGILTALNAGSELTRRHKQIDVVRSDECLCQSHDGTLQGRLAMMVGGMFRDIACQLRHFGVVLKVPLEGCPHDLALHRLEAIDHRWDCSQNIVLRELHQLLVDEVQVCDRLLRMVHELLIIGLVDPLLAVISPFLVECHVERFIINLPRVLKRQAVIVDVAEIFFGFSHRRSSETFVVLQVPTTSIVVFFLPLLVLLHGEELLREASTAHLHNRCDKFRHEPGELKQ